MFFQVRYYKIIVADKCCDKKKNVYFPLPGKVKSIPIFYKYNT